MESAGTCIVFLALAMLFACPAVVTGLMTPSSEDSVHVHLQNASHGAMLHDGKVHDVHATVLQHNDSHSVLHVNSSTAGLHRDVLVSNAVLSDMGLEDPVDGTHIDHSGWNGTEQLVATENGWMSVPVSAEGGQGAMDESDRPKQGATLRVVAAIVGACSAVAVLAVVIFGVIRVRRPRSDATLLGGEDEEFTVFSVVDHPYPGKKGDSYSPLR